MFKKAMIPLLVAGFMIGAQAGDYDVEASPSKVFLGVQLGGAWVQGDHLTDHNYATSGYAYGVRVGAQNNEWRTLVSLDKFDNNESSYERAEVHAQYLFTMPQLADMGLRPFIGLNGGYANYEAKGPDANGSKINESGFTYGAEAGLVYDVSDSIDVDLTYQYTIGHSDRFDHAGTLTLGINYKY
jgi:opacity protein-like surface antigen